MRRTWLAALAAAPLAAVTLAAVASVAGATEPGKRAPVLNPPGVQVERGDGYESFNATLPGKLVAYALAGQKDGRREIVLLARRDPAPAEASAAPSAIPAPPDPNAPCDPQAKPAVSAPQPLVLLRLDPSGPGALETLQVDLPDDVFGLDAHDLDGDGVDEILLSRPGRVDVLRDDGSRRWATGPTLLMTDPGLAPQDSARPGPRAARGDGPNRLFDVSLLGAARFYGPSADHLSWDLVHEAALPVEASRDEAGLKLTGGRIAYVGREAAGAQMFAAGPQAFGRVRLKTLLITPDAARNEETWSRLAGPESVMEAAYLVLDGRPALFVATRPADKLSIFGEKLVRLFLLDEADRSRTGAAPVLAAQSHMNLWQRATPVVADVDRDGRQDLVVGYWKGLKDSRVMLDAYLRKEDGTFARSPVTTGFDVEQGSRSLVAFGRDLDGDGIADLMLRASGRLLVYPGNPASRDGRDLVDRTALWSVGVSGAAAHDADDSDEPDFDFEFGADGRQEGRTSHVMDDSGAPLVADLERDGQPEILIFSTGEGGAGVFQVIRLRRNH